MMAGIVLVFSVLLAVPRLVPEGKQQTGSSVNWEYKKIGPNLFELRLQNVPPYVRPLQMAPKVREAELNAGDWLVLVVGIASVPDQECIQTAVESVQEYGGQVSLGIR